MQVLLHRTQLTRKVSAFELGADLVTCRKSTGRLPANEISAIPPVTATPLPAYVLVFATSEKIVFQILIVLTAIEAGRPWRGLLGRAILITYEALKSHSR